MRGPVSLPLYLLVVVTLLISFVSPAAAQPAPNPCPAGQVFLPAENLCVPPDQVPTAVPTEVPVVVPPEGDLASLTLYHLACDNDFVADAVRDAGGIGPTNGCLTFGKPPFTYAIAANGVPITTTTLDATERDYARLDVPPPVPAGALTITVTPVEGYTTEFVSCALSIGDGFVEIVEPSINGGSATLTTAPDQDVECWVYNVTRVVEDTTITSSGGSANMSFLSVSCPAGTVINADLDRSCTEGLANVTYEILSETETLARNATDGNGALLFEDVPDGLLAIVESVPAGYGQPYVLCTHYSATNGDREYAPAIQYGTGFMATVAPGDDLNCTWYNFPAAGPDNGPNIYIEARTCSPGSSVSTSMTVFEAQALCPNFYVDLEFQVLNVDQLIATARTNVDILSAGQVFFTKLPEPNSGSYGVTASLHDGERTVAVFCDQDFGDGTFQIIPILVRGDRIDNELGMGAGTTMRCTWFIEMNPQMMGTHAPGAPVQDAAPAETGDEAAPVPGITVLAWLCPPEVVAQRVELATVCIVPAEGVTFDVSLAGEPPSTLITDENGEIDVPLGEGAATYQIANQPNPGLSEPSMSCSISRADGTVAQVDSARSDGLPGQEIVFDGESEVVCTFYFLGEVAAEEQAQAAVVEDQAVPAEEAGPDDQTGTEDQGPPAAITADDAGDDAAGETGLSVLTLQCPAEVAGAEVVLADLCTEPFSGLTFEILVDDELIATSVTDANGELAIPGDAGAGMYHFRHEPAPDALEMRTECSSVYPNGATASGSSIAVGSQMSDMYLSYDDASRVTCTFYFVMDAAASQTGEVAEDQAANEGAADDGTTAGAHSFTLQFWTCPEGIDPAAERNSLAQSCSVETNERSFLLTIDGLSAGETITGATTWEFRDGTVYADLGIGPITSVWCDSSWTEAGEAAPEAEDSVSLVDNALTVTVSRPETTVSCDWFIFPG